MYEWLFRDRTSGSIVISQTPNLALWVFIGASLVRLLLDLRGWLGTAVDVTAAGSLAWWAVDEVVRGVNPWRRMVGASALVVLAWTVLG